MRSLAERQPVPAAAAIPRADGRAPAQGERLSGWSVAPAAAAALAIAFGCSHLLDGSLWPSSDLEGHVATIELYRDALAHGILWPYDRGAAFGTDGIPYYAWPCELLLGAIAQGLHLLGVASPAARVAIGVAVGAVAALPLAAAWCALQLAPPDLARSRRRALTHAGALAAWTFLATDARDGITGYGMGCVGMGMLEQLLGWSLLLVVVGAAARAVQEPGRRWVDPRLAAAVALILSVHVMSSVAAALVLAAFAVAAPRRVAASCAAGLCLAAAAWGTVVALADRITPDIPWMSFSGTDPLLAVLSGCIYGEGWQRWCPTAASAAGLALLVAAAWSARGGGVARLAAWACLLLVAAACLPCLHAVLPGGSQPYRLHALALLLALTLGATAAPAVVAAARCRIAPALGYVSLGVFWLGLGLAQAGSWDADRPGCSPAAVLAEAGAIPAGSRVAWNDAAGWHRWAIDAWRLERGWESAGCIHTQILGPVAAALQPALAAIGVRSCTTAVAPDCTAAEAEAILRDAGITHCLRTRHLQPGVPASAADIAPAADPPASWAHLRRPHLDIWTVPDPAPVIERIDAPVIGLRIAEPGPILGILAEWWSRVRARHRLAARLVLVGAQDDPLVRQVIGEAGGARGGGPVIDLAGLPPRRTPDILRGPASAGPLVAAVHQALRPAERFLADAAMRRSGLSFDSADAAHGRPRCAWRDGVTCRLDGLEPGRAYLLRYGWSPGMRSREGRILAEADGMTVVVPSANGMTIRIDRMGTVAWLGIATSTTSALALIAHLALAKRRACTARGRRRAVTAALAPHGMSASPAPPGGRAEGSWSDCASKSAMVIGATASSTASWWKRRQ